MSLLEDLEWSLRWVEKLDIPESRMVNSYFILRSGRNLYPDISIQVLHTYKFTMHAYLARPNIQWSDTPSYLLELDFYLWLSCMVFLKLVWTISLYALFGNTLYCILLSNRFLHILQKFIWLWSSAMQSLGDIGRGSSYRGVLCGWVQWNIRNLQGSTKDEPQESMNSTTELKVYHCKTGTTKSSTQQTCLSWRSSASPSLSEMLKQPW